jgi:hypothetical protein
MLLGTRLIPPGNGPFPQSLGLLDLAENGSFLMRHGWEFSISLRLD